MTSSKASTFRRIERVITEAFLSSLHLGGMMETVM
jgi:hypothetical protein